MLLLQFARDASRELALVMMFAVMTDRKNLSLCHAALSDRSKFNLHKRLGALFMINRSEPGGKYWFDLSKTDDKRALRVVLDLKKRDVSVYFSDVRYAAQCDKQPLEVLPGSETWDRIFSDSSTGSFMRS